LNADLYRGDSISGVDRVTIAKDLLAGHLKLDEETGQSGTLVSEMLKYPM
jgi:hypothetical protein